ncbi:protein phosphatase 2C domain-containing protein [Nocardioides sp. CN2-186]|uniref:PP2C family protein-serine/threonine phosphatase n=1 Tax=Nocardioides tweenelious TaxID=3156607 RepID=UPI0032B5E88E
MNAVELHHGAHTDVGLVREVNEDAFLAAPPVFVVADGMGGHEGGDVASAIVIEEFGRLAEAGYDPRAGADVVATVLHTCQERIADYAVTQRAHGIDPRRHAGTTAVVALLVEGDDGPQWLLANVGDSRIYRLTDGILEQVSVDHSLVQELVDAGSISADDAAVHPERNVITRALGNAHAVEADYFLLPLPSVQRLLLCTDGISGLIDDDAIAQVLTGVPDAQEAADQLVAAALAAGGTDNATAVVIDVRGER